MDMAEEVEQLRLGEMPSQSVAIGSKPERIGGTAVSYRDAGSILSPATGFMSAYDFTLNPYSGCSFGCTYCYAAFFTRDKELQDDWGAWVEAKENAARLIAKRRKGSLRDKRIYMSSVTDPYQPLERHLGLTRAILERLVEHQPRIVIQTRSGLVARDIDLFSKFEHLRVNMTITTDSEEVRRAFEPNCPTTAVRLRAVQELQEAGIRTSITMTPLLPVLDVDAFIVSLVATGIEHFVVQPFHADRGRFVAGTGEKALSLLRDLAWTKESYERTVAALRSGLPSLDEGQEGFAPE